MVWKAALYGRVSTEHEEQQESIQVQREALAEFARDNGYEVNDYYFDEGYTGTNFDRPGIKRLKSDIENSNINMLITKDLSRIGRNNAQTLLFIDYLIENNIRFIAINDNYDTCRDDDDLIGIKTWFNERYSKELSQKIKFALRHKKKNGEYLTAFAPYGYTKSLQYKNKLEIDHFAAGIVRDIFNLYISGLGFCKIASILQKRGIPNPSKYSRYGRKSDRWDWTTIKRIITNPVYAGHSVQQKTCKRSFKSKAVVKTSESEWITVNNTHEAIVEEDTFNITQQVLKKRKDNIKYRSGQGNPHLFTSFLFCHDCGSAMYFKTDKKGRRGYRCGNYVKHGRSTCSGHYISEGELEEIVLTELKAVIGGIDYTKLMDEVSSRYVSSDNVKKQLTYIKEQIDKNSRRIEVLYNDKLDGIITSELFVKLSNETMCIIDNLANEEKRLVNSMDEFNAANIKEKQLEEFKAIMGMKEGIDREVLEIFVKRIEVCDSGDLIIDFNFHSI